MNDQANRIDHLNLWLGDWKSSNNEGFLRKNNIKLIVNCTNMKSQTYYANIKYLQIPIEDRAGHSELLALYLDKSDILDEINTCLHNGNGVLIHCWAGMQRSATVLAVYLMKYKFQYHCYHSIIQYIRRWRAIAFQPSPTFHKYLQKNYGCYSR